MSREWKPGDVAMLGSFVSLRVKYNPVGCPSTHAHDGDHWHRASGDWVIDGGGPSPHPLVVIDPERREQVDRLLARYLSIYDGMDAVPSAGEIASMQAALREFANPTPPKPDEPTGLGAVVEDESGTKWIRHDSVAIHRCWLNTDDCDTRYRAWDEINVVRVLSEGVTP